MSEELNNLVDDILKEKLKLHYENEELEAQGKLIKELCKENEQLHSIIKEVRKNINKKLNVNSDYVDYDFGTELLRQELLEILDKDKQC